jgi:Uma2 family endonuclease
MNSHFRPPDLPMTTQAAEGLARRLWTLAEIEAMVQAGIIDEDERFELIDGEVVPMSPKGAKHEHVKISLNKWWARRLPEGIEIAQETTLRLDLNGFLEPDFVFFPSKTKIVDIKPKTIFLAVEVADASMRYDTGRKAQIYASHSVALLWVIDAETLRTHCFAKPSVEGYLERRLVEPEEVLACPFAPELSLKLAELPLI